MKSARTRTPRHPSPPPQVSVGYRLNAWKIFKIVGVILLIAYISAVIIVQSVNAYRARTTQVLGASARLIEVAPDFAKTTAIGSPLVFGGVHAPPAEHAPVWKLLSDSGVTLIRSDFFLEYCAPKNISLAAYKANTGNVRNITAWPLNCLANIDYIFSSGKTNNMKVVGVMAYMPQWLSRNNDMRSLPSDWATYEDLIRKIYKKNRHLIDYIEVWNEPDHAQFFNNANSGKSKEEAYVELYTFVAKVIRSVDKEANDGKQVKIGGPAISCPCNDGFVEKMLAEKSLRPYIDFISIHSYETGDASLPKIRQLMEKYGYGSTPLYISEWNKSNLASKEREYNQTYLAVPFVAEKLMTYLQQRVAMASYFSLRENDPQHELPERQAYGFYRKDWKGYTLLPQAAVWKLMSARLRLGKGESTIVETKASESLPALSFKNDLGQPGLVIVNKGDRASIRLLANNAPYANQEVDIEISRITESGFEEAYCSERLDLRKSPLQFTFDAPANSVVGVRILPVQLTVKDVLKVLGISTSVDCIET